MPCPEFRAKRSDCGEIIMFYKTTVHSLVPGGVVDSRGKTLTFIGNKVARVGDTIWTDGRVVFGHTPARGSPILAGGNRTYGIPVLFEDGTQGYFDMDGEFHEAKLPVTGRFVNSNRCYFQIPEGVNALDAEIVAGSGNHYRYAVSRCTRADVARRYDVWKGEQQWSYTAKVYSLDIYKDNELADSCDFESIVAPIVPPTSFPTSGGGILKGLYIGTYISHVVLGQTEDWWALTTPRCFEVLYVYLVSSWLITYDNYNGAWHSTYAGVSGHSGEGTTGWSRRFAENCRSDFWAINNIMRTQIVKNGTAGEILVESAGRAAYFDGYTIDSGGNGGALYQTLKRLGEPYYIGVADKMTVPLQDGYKVVYELQKPDTEYNELYVRTYGAKYLCGETYKNYGVGFDVRYPYCVGSFKILDRDDEVVMTAQLSSERSLFVPPQDMLIARLNNGRYLLGIAPNITGYSTEIDLYGMYIYEPETGLRRIFKNHCLNFRLRPMRNVLNAKVIT